MEFRWLGRLATGALCGALWLAASLPADAADAANAAAPISPDAYLAKLQSLDQLVSGCRSSMQAANCGSSAVGPDLQVSFPSGVRAIRLDWLRQLLDHSAKGEDKSSPPVGKRAASAAGDVNPVAGPELTPAVQPEHPFHPPSLATQLEDAHLRLAADEAMVRSLTGLAEKNAGSGRAGKAGPSSQRQVLSRILAAPEYRSSSQGPTLMQQLQEKVGNWINRLIARLIQASSKSRWIGITAEIAFVSLLCGGLVWFLIRLERKGRAAPLSIGSGPGAGTASARDWQLWLEDARRAAERGEWRDAIHLSYWACISRLESSGLWPADRARTPREYLALLAPESPQRSGLAALTRSFERAWYAGRPATEADYREAEQLTQRLGIGGRGLAGAR